MSNHNTRNSIVKGMIWKMSERLISLGVSFLVSVVLARLLAPDDYGLIALVMVFINIANVFIVSGFSTALIQKKDADNVDFSTIYFCAQGCSIIIYGILFFVSPFIAQFYGRTELILIIRIFALIVPISVYNSVQSAYVSRNMRFEKLFVASIISAIISGVVGITMAYMGYGVWALVAQAISSTIVNTAVMSFTVPWRVQAKFSKKSAKLLMSYGSRVLLADLSGTFFGELRSLIIGRVYTSADLAFYTKGQHLPTLITNNLGNTIMTVMFPAFANKSDDLESVKQMAKRSMKVLAYVLVPSMLGLVAIMEPLVIFLFTEKWAQIIPYGQVLSMGYCIGVFGIVSLQVLKAIGRSDVVLKLEIIKKPVYILLLLIGVRINVFAIAITMVIYDFYGVFINMLQMKKYIDYGLREQFRDLSSAFLLSIVMAIAVFTVPILESLLLTILIKVFIGIIIYILGSIVFKIETFQYLLEMIRNKMK